MLRAVILGCLSAAVSFSGAALGDEEGAMVEFDEYNNTIVNGKPFFPIYIFRTESEEELLEVKAAGFNTTFFGLTEIAEKHRMKVMGGGAGLKDNPVFLAYYMADEPDLYRDAEGNLQNPPSWLDEACKEQKRQDPNHPTLVMLSGYKGYADFPEFVSTSVDIIATDPYPVLGERPISSVVERMKYLRSITDKPIWVCLQAWTDSWEPPGMPTPHQNRAMAYMAVVYGAKAVGWYAYRFCDRIPNYAHYEVTKEVFPELWESICQVAAELKMLSRALTSPTPTVVQVAGSVHYIEKEDAHFRYLIAVETEGRSQTPILPLSSSVPARQARVVSEDRKVEIPHGKSITDSFAGYDVHIYKMRRPH